MQGQFKFELTHQKTAKLMQVSELTQTEKAGKVLSLKKCSCGKSHEQTKELYDFDLSMLRRVVHTFQRG